MNTTKMTAFIVGAMLIATVLVMAVSAAGMDRDKYLGMPRMVYEFDAVDDTGIYINDVDVFIDPDSPDTDSPDTKSVPTLRIYGEEGAVYPTHSYYGTDDFVYPNPVDPFDPGILAKDSVTFDPAYMRDAASVDDDLPLEHDEKAYFRVFYEPEYAHGADALMGETLPNPYPLLAPVTMIDGALVTETTYMMVTGGKCSSGLPLTGAADETRFKLPTLSKAGGNAGDPGMDTWTDDNLVNDDLVDLLFAEKGSTLTDGTIEVGIRVELNTDESVRFMDHEIRSVNPCGTNAVFEIGYIGNRNDKEYAVETVYVPNGGPTVYVDRYHITPSDSTNAEHRWFVRNAIPDGDCEKSTVTIGRRLVAGETFYVDGVRYDMPAIYVTDDDEFKYITLQSPLPKCPSVECKCEDLMDYSHVSCQWLSMLCMSDPTHLNATGAPDPIIENAWVLPPFNGAHLKIDDINLAETEIGCSADDITVTEAGKIFHYPDNALEFYYIEEYIEERFDSSLAERHYRKDGVEIWNWWNVYTKPYKYTTLVLPNDEIAGESYCGEGYTDGDEYIVTTSFIAPNSEDDNRHADCKDPETHDIIDRTKLIALNSDRNAYYEMPRMVFRYDAVNRDDLFVNEDRGMKDEPSVRVYGEAGAIYPTQSFTGAEDFIYPNHVDPFDPGVIAKDSVTFNPAYIDHYYQYGRKMGGQEIKYYSDAHEYGVDGEEKVYLRAFYEPGYAHVTDSKMPGMADVNMPLGALVTETTYMLTMDNDNSGHSGLPVAARAQLDVEGRAYTKFVLPTTSTNPDMPGMETADLVGLAYASGVGTDQLTDGEIDVQLTKITLKPEASIDFMDHRYTFLDITQQGEILMEIEYLGNMYGYEAMQEEYSSLDEDQKYWVTRSNNIEHSTTPQRRPYFTVTDRYYHGDDWEDRCIVMVVGRRLVAGETFYVDGVRYDMPAIYVTGDNKFKYITLQSPLPKCEGPMWHSNGEDNLKDPSHVSSQWLANIVQTPSEHQGDITDVWVLPPFNHPHLMIDDIGIDKDWNCDGTKEDISVEEAGNILGVVPELEFYYIAEKAELRFNSNLAERLNSDGSTEIWNWWNIFTKPYQYTELVLPNQETTRMADGNEYLITTSFIAPNCEGAVRDMDDEPFCKPYDTHDIIDRAATLDPDMIDPCPWDFDGTKTIDISDIVILASHWGEDWPNGEFSGDTTIDISDIVIVASHWGDCPDD